MTCGGVAFQPIACEAHYKTAHSVKEPALKL